MAEENKQLQEPEDLGLKVPKNDDHQLWMDVLKRTEMDITGLSNQMKLATEMVKVAKAKCDSYEKQD